MSREFEYIQFFKTIRYPCVILRTTGKRFDIVDANDAYLKLCVFNLEDMKGKDFFELFPINPYINPEEWEQCFDSVLRSKNEVNLGVRKLVYPLNAQTTFLDVRYYDIHHVPILDKDGAVEYIVRSLLDVTQLVIQKELHHESQQSVQYGNWWINIERGTMEWSTGFKDILEIPHDFQPSIESAKQFYLCEEEEKSFYKSVGDAIAQKNMFKTVLSIVTATGNKRWLLLIGKPVVVENICVGMRGVAKDITEKLAYIDRIENQHNNLKDIAYAQSHLVRAPLARILALVQHLKQRFRAGNVEPDLLDALDHSANELDLVIHDIIRKTANENIIND